MPGNYLDRKADKYDRQLSNFVAGYFLVQALNLFVKIGLGGLPGWGILSKGIMGLLLLSAIPALYSRAKIIAVCSAAVLLNLFLITLLIGTANTYSSSFFSIVFNAVLVYLPIGLCTFAIKDKNILLKKMYLFSWPAQAMLVLLLLGFARSSGADYSMSCGYALEFQLLIVLDHFFHEKKWHDAVIILVDMLAILIGGSRGPILCILLYLLIRLVFSQELSMQKKFIITFFSGTVVLLLFLNFNRIIALLVDVLGSAGHSSRTLRMLMTDSITKDSGRGNIIAYYLERIWERPFTGWGLAGGWTFEEMYPHNIVVELFLSFGIPLGIILTIILFFVLCKGFVRAKGVEQRMAHILIADMCSLMLSGSFIMSASFFMGIAACGAQSSPPKPE